MDEARLRDNLAEQTALYGAGVGELLAGVTRPLGLSQAAVARILGLSPAMLSQLVTGHRVRIGNPRVLHRLRLLLDLAEESPRLTRRTLAGRLAEIGRASADLTTRERPVTAATTRTARTPAETMTALLRAAASPEELDRAAAALDDVAPGVAALLRAHGPGAPERPLTR